MVRALLCWCLLLIYTLPAAGTYQHGHMTVSGVVKDADTGENIAFASISVQNSHIGTVSNADGEFILKIPDLPEITGISVSHIGYRRTDFDVSDIIAGTGDFLIEPYPVVLDEIVIKPADARAIVYQALNKTVGNYPAKPNRLTGFYRETIRQRNDYISISEAVVDIYQAPYRSERESDMFRIIRGRRSGNVKKADTLLVKLQGGPHISMLLDVVKNPGLLFPDESLSFFSFELVDIVRIDDISNYVIDFRPRMMISYPLYYGKLYISVDRLAITMAEFSLDLSDRSKASKSFVLKKPARLRFEPVNTRYLVSYKYVNGRYNIDYMRYELEFFADWRRKIFRTGYTIMSEMAITGRSNVDVARFKASESFRSATVLADQVPVYFEDDYWGVYNFIVPEKSTERAIRKLNRRLDW